MKTCAWTLFCLLTLCKLNAQLDKTLKIPSDTLIAQWLEENKVPAIAIATIQNGQLQPLLVQGKTPSGLTADKRTIFDVASLTKSITTLVTLQLVDDNAWDIDKPLSSYWVDPDVADDTLHNLLTTRHVLSHKSGFKNWRWMNEDKKLAFDFKPGTKVQYSGEGFEYLRRALENKFQISFEVLADSLVFQPNNMKDSYLIWNKEIEDQRFAGTHDKSGKAYTYEKSKEANAADNLLTTAQDLGQLGVNLLNRQILATETYQEMISPQSKVREGIDFGLGWIVFNGLSNGEYALFNAGSDQGVNALMVFLPKSKRGLVVLTNGDNGRALAMRMIGEILGTVGQEILGRI